MQLGNAFLFIKPVCASPPALFKRGSQTLPLAYLIFAPLPTSSKMGARTSRPSEVTKRNLFAGIFLCKRVFEQEHLQFSQPSKDTKRNYFAGILSCKRVFAKEHLKISQPSEEQFFCRNIFVLESLCRRTSPVFSTIRGHQEQFFCKTNINVHQGFQVTKPNFFAKQVIFCYSF